MKLNRSTLYQALTVACLLLAAWAYLYCDGGFALARYQAIGINTTQLGLGERLRQLIYLTNYIAAFVTIWLLARSANRLIRFAFLPLVLAAILFEATYTRVVGRPASLSDIFTINMAIVTNTGNAVHEFRAQILIALVYLIIGILALLVATYLTKQRDLAHQPRFKIPRRLKQLALAFSFGYLLMSYAATLYARGEPALIGFPKGFSYLLGTALMAPATRTEGKLVKAQPSTLAIGKFEKVIYVIDESIWGEAFNDFKFDTKITFFDNHAFSLGNCSAASNFYLRKGVKLSAGYRQVQSLFELAKEAGFETTYIDTQGVLHDPTTRNYFDQSELKFVDHKFDIENRFQPWQRDDEALKLVQENLKQPGKSFLIVNKYGAHFPYYDNLPEAERSHDRMLDYAKTVKLHTKNFLDTLQKNFNAKTLILYTSDHGQNVAGPSTHCGSGSDAKLAEWQVPIAVMSADPELIRNLSSRMSNSKQKFLLTHNELIESARNALGFEVAGVGSIFKLDLLEKYPAEHCFNYGPPLGFFGKSPNCQVFALPQR